MERAYFPKNDWAILTSDQNVLHAKIDLLCQVRMIILKVNGGCTMSHHIKEYKELGCRDFKQDCDFTVRAKTEGEVLDKCRVHACSAHGKCNDSPEIREKIRSRIRDVL